MAQRKDTTVEDARQIGLLASPARIEIVDTLESLGEAVSVAELAARLGRTADSLYYHLRALAKGGLIDEQIDADGRRYRARTRAGRRLRLRYKPGGTANARAVNKVATSVLRVAGRDFARALADPDTVVEGPMRELWAARGKGWVRNSDLAEINRLLLRLMDLLHTPRDGAEGRLVALTWILAPLDAKPARRATKKTTRSART